MSDPKPEIEGQAIVLVGSFNPAIFHPSWFAREKLIQWEEAERAEIRIVSPDVTVFSIGWVGFEVTLDRFVARTTQMQHLDSLRDLALGTFGLLRHTPVKIMGLNRQAHFRSPSEEQWHQLGHRLAPKEPWAGLLRKPGMRRLQIEGERPDQHRGKIRVDVEPSLQLSPGVFIEVNDHYEYDRPEKGLECGRMMEILAGCWENSLAGALHIMQSIVKSQ